MGLAGWFGHLLEKRIADMGKADADTGSRWFAEDRIIKQIAAYCNC